MADLREVFEMATKQMEPDQDSWRDQERRQRRQARNRKIAAFAAVFAIVIAAGALALTQRHTTSKVAHRPSPGGSGAIGGLRWLSPSIVGLDGSVRTPLSSVPVNARSMSLSPDGRQVAFVWNENGINQVGTVDLSSGKVVLFAPSPGVDLASNFPTSPGAMMPAWSPDGSKIAFTNGHIYVANADGSGVRRLTHERRGVDLWPTWSPDGSTIVYSNSGTGELGSGFSNTQEIWTVPAAGGTPRRLTHNDVSDDMPAYSPNGSLIAFFSAGSISVMHADGTHVRSLPGLPGSIFNPRWSPDGTHLVYTQYRGGRASDGGPLLTIHIYDLKTGTTTTVPGRVDSDVDAPQWVSNHTLLVNRYTGG